MLMLVSDEPSITSIGPTVGPRSSSHDDFRGGGPNVLRQMTSTLRQTSVISWSVESGDIALPTFIPRCWSTWAAMLSSAAEVMTVAAAGGMPSCSFGGALSSIGPEATPATTVRQPPCYGRSMGRPSAGMICVAPTGRIFLMRRSAQVNNPGYWSIPAGRIDRGESPLQAAVRELYEEAGYARELEVTDHIEHQRSKRKFHYFVARVPVQFLAKLNWENDDAGWFDPARLPEPLHPGMLGMLRGL